MPPQFARKSINAYHHGDLRDALVQAALGEAEQVGPEAISIKALAKKTGCIAAGALPAFRRPRGAAGGGYGRGVPAIQYRVAGVDQKAVQTFEAIAPRAGHADLRPSPQRHLPVDVRFANHGVRRKGQRTSSGRNRNLRSGSGSTGGSRRWIAARAARPANLGCVARRGHAGGAGAAYGQVARMTREELVEDIVAQTKLALSVAIEAAGRSGARRASA